MRVHGLELCALILPKPFPGFPMGLARGPPDFQFQRTCEGWPMRFKTRSADSRRWRWMLMSGSTCLATSVRSFHNEFDCLIEIEKIRAGVSLPESSPKHDATQDQW